MKKHSIKSTVVILGIYSLLSWTLFASTLSGKGLGNTLASLGLYILGASLAYHLLIQAAPYKVGTPVTLGISYALALLGLVRVLSIWQASNLIQSTLLPTSLMLDQGSTRYLLITTVLALCIYLLATNHKTQLFVNLCKSDFPKTALKKATTCLNNIGRYCLYRLCICIPLALVVWLTLSLVKDSNAISVAYISTLATFVPTIGWALAIYILFPALVTSHGLLFAIRDCVLVSTTYLLINTLVSKKFKEYDTSKLQVVLVSILSFTLLGVKFSLISGAIYVGVISLLTTKGIRRYQKSSAT